MTSQGRDFPGDIQAGGQESGGPWAEATLTMAGDETAVVVIERLPNPRDGRGVLVRLTPIGKDLAEDALATLLGARVASLETLQASEQADLANLLRALLIGFGDTPAFRPTIAVHRG